MNFNLKFETTNRGYIFSRVMHLVREGIDLTASDVKKFDKRNY